MKSCNDTGDSFLMSGPNVKFLNDSVSQALKIDDKDSEQLSAFVSQGKNITHPLVLAKLLFSWLRVALLKTCNATGVLVSFFQIRFISVQNQKNGFNQLLSISNQKHWIQVEKIIPKKMFYSGIEINFH